MIMSLLKNVITDAEKHNRCGALGILGQIIPLFTKPNSRQMKENVL